MEYPKKKTSQCVWPHTMQHFIHYVVTGQKNYDTNHHHHHHHHHKKKQKQNLQILL